MDFTTAAPDELKDWISKAGDGFVLISQLVRGLSDLRAAVLDESKRLAAIRAPDRRVGGKVRQHAVADRHGERIQERSALDQERGMIMLQALVSQISEAASAIHEATEALTRALPGYEEKAAQLDATTAELTQLNSQIAEQRFALAELQASTTASSRRSPRCVRASVWRCGRGASGGAPVAHAGVPPKAAAPNP